MYNKYKGDALSDIISEKISPKELKKYELKTPSLQKNSSGSFSAISSKLLKPESDLLSFVFDVIKKAQAASTAEKLIAKIQEEIKNKYISRK